ncbi:Cytochrome c family protein [Rhodopirellula islandica]|uniref:Cytochrome c family protein n=1 Tax=Rhodopirellula islandica TaxID=595434 RepID=A0A0J1BM53_RHOIS|nr:DUF3365 domain-containing protein [Rhodopirellula islandica]KLU07533.1 Cytochrome c family protein [Rhodopirellula islandica]
MRIQWTASAGILAIAGTFLLVNLGCQKSAPPVTEDVSEQDASAVSIVEGETPSEEQKQAMLQAKDALFQKLSGRLMEAMGSQGPAGAIAVCQKEANQIATDVGDQHGVMIGRTGVRLRNTKNLPPSWAKSMTEAKVSTPQFVSLTNGHAAALLPIQLQSQCLMCHGPTEQIAPVISDQLTKLYPNDQATGFREGELRGWFWVETPAI